MAETSSSSLDSTSTVDESTDDNVGTLVNSLKCLSCCNLLLNTLRIMGQFLGIIGQSLGIMGAFWGKF